MPYWRVDPGAQAISVAVSAKALLPSALGSSVPRETIKSFPGNSLSISAAELARQIDVPVNRVTGIINAQRALTADTALRLGDWFGTNPKFWRQIPNRTEIPSVTACERSCKL
jgi:addiction module HigA family antidote